MKRIRFQWILAGLAAVVLSCAALACARPETHDAPARNAAEAPAAPALEPRETISNVEPERAVTGPSIGFRTRRHWLEHFEKHGREFGNIDAERYLALAQALRDGRVSASVLEAARGDGATSRFDRASGAFGAYDRDGTIRTFFKPRDGEAYFRRQIMRYSKQ